MRQSIFETWEREGALPRTMTFGAACKQGHNIEGKGVRYKKSRACVLCAGARRAKFSARHNNDKMIEADRLKESLTESKILEDIYGF